MTAEEMWRTYQAINQELGNEVSAFQFGAEPDILAQLVLNGIKTATASAYPLYSHYGESLPQVNQYDVILDSSDTAVCIIRTKKVYLMPFNQITAEHAFKEGEGDRSLAYWREVHLPFFETCLAEANMTFDEATIVVCEEFDVVYPTA